LELNKMETYIYFILLIFFIPVNFKVLLALNIEKNFKKEQIWQIKYAYIVISVLVSHWIASFLVGLQQFV